MVLDVELIYEILFIKIRYVIINYFINKKIVQELILMFMNIYEIMFIFRLNFFKFDMLLLIIYEMFYRFCIKILQIMRQKLKIFLDNVIVYQSLYYF